MYCLYVWSLVLGQGFGVAGQEGQRCHPPPRQSPQPELPLAFQVPSWEMGVTAAFVKATAELSSKGAGPGAGRAEASPPGHPSSVPTSLPSSSLPLKPKPMFPVIFLTFCHSLFGIWLEHPQTATATRSVPDLGLLSPCQLPSCCPSTQKSKGTHWP